MKKVKDLLTHWENASQHQLTEDTYAIRLPVADAARLEALAEMYGKLGIETILTDLISSALDELETAIPYVKGERVIATDEFGDPIYEDIGPSQAFHTLARKHRQLLTDA